jgi:DNA polymerase-4
MDAFYASVEQRDQPDYAERPVIVGGLGPRGVVAAASYEAREHGVHSAMPMARARRLCRQGVFLSPRMPRYRAVSRQIFKVFAETTPLVEGLSLDEAFLDVTGSLRLFGSIREIGNRLRGEIRDRTGLVASIGMARNKFLAKLASDADKPAGFVEIGSGEEQRFLDPMPIGRMWGIGPKTEPRLRRMGILTIGQLRRAEPAALEPVLGNRTARFLALARGEDDRPVTPERAEKSISHEVTFQQDLTNPRVMRSELLRLAEAVARRLRAHGLSARTVTVKIRDHRFHSVTRSRTLHAATNRTDTIFKVSGGLLEAWLTKHVSTPVRLLGVGASGLQEAAAGRPALDEALDQISQRYGNDTITRALSIERDKGSGR